MNFLSGNCPSVSLALTFSTSGEGKRNETAKNFYKQSAVELAMNSVATSEVLDLWCSAFQESHETATATRGAQESCCIAIKLGAGNSSTNSARQMTR